VLKDLVRKNRSCRRFYQEVAIELDTLRELVDLARLSASGANRQPLRYILVCDPVTNSRVFPLLGWAGYLQDWPGPVEGERPSAYIIVLGDTEINKSFGVDHGIAAQSITLGATEKGLAGCIIQSVQRKQLCELLEIPSRYEVLLVLALGKPREQIQIDPVGTDGGIKYWRDDRGVHHVPKRSLDEIVLAEK
jgi:nitroreductase